MSKAKKIKTAVAVILSIAVFLLVFFLLQRLVTPKYASGIVEGGFVREYYDDAPDHDVIFIGDCEVYENFSPVTLWEEYGINSYIRGSAEQYIFQSYYLLEDTLLYEKPKAVVFNIQSLQFSSSRSEAYNRMTIDGMKWSKYKVGAINASMTEEENMIEYIFPILRYHSRITELEADDFRYLFSNKKVSHNGYYMRVDVRPVGAIPSVKPLPDYSFGDEAWDYLDKIADACLREGVQLVLIKAPSLFPHWYDEWDAQVKEYAAKRELPYYNMIELAEEIGIDYSTDTYDGGLHMNLSGAEKCARWIGKILQNDYSLEDRKGESELAASWEVKIADYEKEIEEQKKKYNIE